MPCSHPLVEEACTLGSAWLANKDSAGHFVTRAPPSSELEHHLNAAVIRFVIDDAHASADSSG